MFVMRKKKRPSRSSSVIAKNKKNPTNIKKRDNSPAVEKKIDSPNPLINPESKRPPISTNKQFHFIINNKPFLHHNFKINIQKFPLIRDLKTEIANSMKIEPIYIKINGFKAEEELSKIPNNFIFQISILNPSKNINFRLPNNETITITNGSSMTFDEIIENFQNFNYYFSQRSIVNNLNFYIWSFKIPKDDFELSFLPPDNFINVKLEGNFVKMQIRGKIFIFTDGESISSTKIINQAFKLNDKIMIKFIPKEMNSVTKTKLIKGVEYSLNLLYKFEFIYLKTNKKYQKLMKYNSTVLDVKKIFSTFFCDNGELKEDNIIIYDEKKCIVNDLNQRLKKLKIIYFDINYTKNKDDDKKEKTTSIHKRSLSVTTRNKKGKPPQFEDFRSPQPKKVMKSSFFDDTKQINLIFDESNKTKFESFTNYVETSMSIKELEKNISKKYNIKEKIIIGYKNGTEKVFINDPEITIGDIMEKIIPECILYIKIEPQTNIQKIPYKFEYEEIIEEIKFLPNSLLINNELQIKKIFNIKPSEKIIFILIKEEDEKIIENWNQEMKSFTDEIIHIYLKNAFNNTVIRMKSPNVTLFKYFYQINNFDSIKEIELDSEAKVRTFKRAIARENNISNLSNIKIYFNGRILQNDEKLINLDNYYSIFFVYIRNEDDIFLMSTKNIQVSKSKEDENEENQINLKSNELFFMDSELVDEFMKTAKLKKKGDKSEIYKVNQVVKFIENRKSIAMKFLSLNIHEKGKDTQFIDDQFENLKRFIQEYEIIIQLNHPNIIKSFGFFYGDKKYNPCILLEYFKKNLEQSIQDLSDVELVEIIYEISDAMNHVHEAGIIHRNLKPSNILIDEEKHAKISDFGISTLFSYVDVSDSLKFHTNNVGEIGYMAPEMYGDDGDYNEKVDVYSFGVLLLFILTRNKSPKIKPRSQIQRKIPQIPKCVNESARSLILRCISFDPKDRPSFQEITKFIRENEFNLVDGVESYLPLIHAHLGL